MSVKYANKSILNNHAKVSREIVMVVVRVDHYE